jgi:hypothetical protein
MAAIELKVVGKDSTGRASQTAQDQAARGQAPMSAMRSARPQSTPFVASNFRGAEIRHGE